MAWWTKNRIGVLREIKKHDGDYIKITNNGNLEDLRKKLSDLFF